jgi:hypothetical protein
MAYAEGSAYITHAELTTWVDTEDLSSLGLGSSSASLGFREAASGYLDEQAMAAGVEVPLAAAYITSTMKRRLAVMAAHLGTPKAPEFRDDKGRGPYAAEHDAAKQELKDWATGLRPAQGDAADDYSPVAVTSQTRRRW